MEQILKNVIEYVTEVFKKETNPKLAYHNYYHTLDVVMHAMEIAGHCQLPQEELLTVEIAAWFHDVGHLFGQPLDHEKRSVIFMRSFMEKQAVPASFTEKIADCILATRFPSSPVRLSEKILCDADTYHLGTTDFFEKDKLVREELKLREQVEIKDWSNYTLHFLEHHHYFTTYCQQKLEPIKAQNIQLLKDQHNRTGDN